MIDCKDDEVPTRSNTSCVVFWNSLSGNAAANLSDHFSPDSSHLVDIADLSESPDALVTILRRSCDVVVAAGGDGTINAIANAVMQLPREDRPKFGILPLGTANDLALTLGIPSDIDAAVKVIERGRSILFDAIRVAFKGKTHYFVNVATGGNGPRVSEAITDELKARWGALCYLRGAVEVLSDLVSYQVELECDGDRMTPYHAWAVIIANGKSNAGHMLVAPNASVSDGVIDVILVRDGTGLDLVKVGASLLQGNLLDNEQVIYRRAHSIRIRSTPGMKFAFDGEVCDEANTEDNNEIRFDAIPNAFEVFAGDGLIAQ